MKKGGHLGPPLQLSEAMKLAHLWYKENFRSAGASKAPVLISLINRGDI